MNTLLNHDHFYNEGTLGAYTQNEGQTDNSGLISDVIMNAGSIKNSGTLTRVSQKGGTLENEATVHTLDLTKGDFTLSTREKKFFSQWAQYGFGDEILRLAYDQTVDSSGKAAVGLMNTILAGWYQKGVRCVADAENCIAEHKNEMKKQYAKKKETPGSFAESSFDTDEFFDIALKKSMEIAREQQDGDKK